MNVGELRELLEDLDDELKVCVAIQPNYPMEHTVKYMCHIDEENGKFYLVEGCQVGYLPGSVAEEIGW